MKKLNNSTLKLDISFGVDTFQTLGDCVKELIEKSYQIYQDILSYQIPSTIVCGGQSPAYFCLVMKNFNCYDPQKVDIVILPHSMGGNKNSNLHQDNINYGNRLKEKNVKLKSTVFIIDGVHSGVGILSLESALLHTFSNIKIYKIAINASDNVKQIKVDHEYIIYSEPKFSDTFPRIINSFYPRDFNDSQKFITDFNIEDNQLAYSIINLSKQYPLIDIQYSEWFQSNNQITIQIKQLKHKHFIELFGKIIKLQINENKKKNELIKKNIGGKFKTIILNNPKRYQCPCCKTITGTLAVKYPEDQSLFSHRYNCRNKYKIPVE